MVQLADKKGCQVHELGLDELTKISKFIESDIQDRLSFKAAIQQKMVLVELIFLKLNINNRIRRNLNGRTKFSIYKPDGVKRRLMAEVIRRFETRGFVFKKLELRQLTSDRWIDIMKNILISHSFLV